MSLSATRGEVNAGELNSTQQTYRSTLSELDAAWAKFNQIKIAARQICGCLGTDEFWGKPVDKELLFVRYFIDPPLITREQYDEGFHDLERMGYIKEIKQGIYMADQYCRYIAADVMPYEHAKLGLIPNW